jgi:hypothetical protein
MPPSSSEGKHRLKGYGAVPTIEASTILIEDANVSWVQAYAIQQQQKQQQQQRQQQHQPKESEWEALETDDLSPASSHAPRYRDVPFAIAYLANLVTMLLVAICYGSFDFGQEADADADADAGKFSHAAPSASASLVALLLVSASASFLLPFFLIGAFVPRYPRTSVAISLLVSVLCIFSLVLMLFISYPSLWMLLFTVAIAAVFVWYVVAMEAFIPFAAAILKIAAKGVTQNWGVYMVSAVLAAGSLLWSLLWVYIANGVGLFDDLASASANTNTNTNSGYYAHDNGGTGTAVTAKAFFLLLSLYWTITVITNITQTTVAGIIGTYCFDKSSASTFLSPAVRNSLHRSCTTSFGSICFGSLLHALITTLRVLADWARNNAQSNNEGSGGAALLFCVLQCLLSLVEDIIEYFNQWAYAFVGIYGMSYLESGKAVIELFQARGCSAILTNQLSMYVLNTVVLITGMVCGIVGILCSHWLAYDPSTVFW